MGMEMVMVMVMVKQQRPLKKQQRHQPKVPQKEPKPLRERRTEPLMALLTALRTEPPMELKRRQPQQRVPQKPQKERLLPQLKRQQQPPRQLPLGLQQLQLLGQQPQLQRPQRFPPQWLWPLEKRTKRKRFCQVPKTSMTVVQMLMNIMNTQKPKGNPKANQNPAAAVATSPGNLFCSSLWWWLWLLLRGPSCMRWRLPSPSCPAV
mmetsp:Transcript_71784/g.113785  ORF Transcript_71784/g.113785 Transcript_71784/m.113785 type:complete len:206 (+) Transcript_71784:350-967(+)